MGRGRKQRPSDPEAARLARRAKDLALVGMQPEAAALKQHEAVEVTRMAEETGQGKKAGHNVARRMDAFDALKDGMQPGAYDAAKRLMREIMESLLQGDRGRRMERVDCAESEKEFKFVLAADSVAKVERNLAPRDWWLLHELIAPVREYDGWKLVWVDSAGNVQTGEPLHGWRAVVGYITGEVNKDAQGARVRAACENLRDLYEALERKVAA